MQRLTADLLSVSLDRPEAPSWVRTRVPPGRDERRRRLEGSSDLAGERLVLHTCERFEVYAAQALADPEPWLERLGVWLDLEPARVGPFVRFRRGAEAVRHLLRVAAGLESRLVGEPQIQGQVRQAFREAREVGTLGPLLDALARAALHAGRRARHETLLGRGGASIVDIALDRLRAELGSVFGRSVIVCGTGALAQEIVLDLTRSGAKVTIASRTPARAQALAARFRIGTLHRSELAQALVHADALVTCTHGPVPVERPTIDGRHFAILDLGIPPNVDIHAGEWAGVRLIALDDLTPVAVARDVSKAAAIVEEEQDRFRRWRAGRRVAGVLSELTRPGRPRASRGERRALHLEIERIKAEAAA